MGDCLSDLRSAPSGLGPGRAGKGGVAVTSRDRPSDYQTLVRRCRPTEAEPKTIEQQLDALLSLQQKRQSGQEQAQADPELSPLDQLRRQMRDELMPVFEDLKAKYQEAGILLEMDADDFLSGGVGLLIEVEFDNHGMQLQGTVTPRGIAFQDARYTSNTRSVIGAGPMLLIRSLTGQRFREFLCERISQLVRSVLRNRPASRSDADHA